jgi:hypothetical protein
MHYQLNTPQVIFEAFDDEVLVIDFDSGRYFSMRGSAFDIWKMILAGCDGPTMCVRLAAHHGASLLAVQAAVHDHLGRLAAEGLIVAGQGEAANGACDLVGAGAFEAPVMEQFTDMQELLLLDPIHEVDQTGWPKKQGA